MAVAPADPTWPVHTDRLRLRRASGSDAEASWRYHRLAPVGRWISVMPRDHDTYIHEFTTVAPLDSMIMVELADGHREGAGDARITHTVIGDLKLKIENAWAQEEVTGSATAVQAEIGWAFDPAYQGRGYATEAVAELLRIAFEDFGLRRVFAYCFAANEPSWRLMERLGMRREAHHVADGLHRSGEWMDGFAYAMLADEWRAHHRR